MSAYHICNNDDVKFTRSYVPFLCLSPASHSMPPRCTNQTISYDAFLSSKLHNCIMAQVCVIDTLLQCCPQCHTTNGFDSRDILLIQVIQIILRNFRKSTKNYARFARPVINSNVVIFHAEAPVSDIHVFCYKVY